MVALLAALAGVSALVAARRCAGALDRELTPLALLATAGPIADRVRGLLRIGERRWDLMLDRDQRIMLPENDAIAALERVLALNEINELLARDLVAIDMRDGRRPTLRLGEAAVEFFKQITTNPTGDDA